MHDARVRQGVASGKDGMDLLTDCAIAPDHDMYTNER